MVGALEEVRVVLGGDQNEGRLSKGGGTLSGESGGSPVGRCSRPVAVVLLESRLEIRLLPGSRTGYAIRGTHNY